MSDSMFCEIRIKGHLAQQWSDWLGGLAIENQPDGCARLSGSLADQAALYGVLCQVRDLGVVLVSIHCVQSQFFRDRKRARGEHDKPQPETRQSR
jgi:hypothetical protein